MRKSIAFIILFFLIQACDDPSKPDGTGYTTINYSEPTVSLCPYCYGSGVKVTFYGPQYCPNCGGSGQVTNISFKGRQVKTLKKSNKKCPERSTTFECIDEHNNEIISSTDKCIKCGHMYYVHE